MTSIRDCWAQPVISEDAAAARFTGLDGLRGLAALIVAFGHAAYISGSPAFAFLDKTYLVVDFFFLLSGFVLAKTYESRMPTSISFLRMRYQRLFLPLAAGTALGAAQLLTLGTPAPAVLLTVVPVLLFLPVGGSWHPNAPVWSVFFEVVANLAHALLLHKLSKRSLAAIAAGSALLLATQTDLNVGQGEKILLGFPRVFLSYSLGILLWRCNADRLRFPAWVGYIGLPLLILVASTSIFSRADLLLVLLVNPLFLLAGLAGRSRWGVLLGALSFPLYAVHWPVQVAAIHAGSSWLTAFFLSLAAAAVVGFAVDKRFRRACDLVAKHRRDATASKESPLLEAEVRL